MKKVGDCKQSKLELKRCFSKECFSYQSGSSDTSVMTTNQETKEECEDKEMINVNVKGSLGS